MEVEELKQIEALGVQIMEQIIRAYREITASDEFRALERMREDARHNEASALANARREGALEECAKWQAVVAEKDAEIAEKDAEIARLRAQLGIN